MGSTSSNPDPAQFLSKLQRQYEEGKFWDVCVRCVVLRGQQEEQEEDA